MTMDLTTEAVRLGIRMAHLRAEVASENIALASTPGSRAKGADFSRAIDLLQQAAADPRMSSDSLSDMTAPVLRGSVDERINDDARPVSLDAQVADLDAANVDYQTLTGVMSRRFALMELAMEGKS
jgi:flagellar basal-body rod protein FlgB